MTASRAIIVAGAGIGGLTAALALARQRRQVIVVERADRLEEAGAGLQLSPNAARILTTLGLGDTIAARAVTPAAVDITTTAFGRVARIPLHANADAPYWVIHRADLQAALLNQIAQTDLIDLRLGSTVEGFDIAPATLNLHVRQAGAAQTISGPALIGADGVWSAVREQLFPLQKPIFSGSIAWRGTVETRHLTAIPPSPECPAMDGQQRPRRDLSDVRRRPHQCGRDSHRGLA